MTVIVYRLSVYLQICPWLLFKTTLCLLPDMPMTIIVYRLSVYFQMCQWLLSYIDSLFTSRYAHDWYRISTLCLLPDMPMTVIVYRLSVYFSLCLTVSSLYLPMMKSTSSARRSRTPPMTSDLGSSYRSGKFFHYYYHYFITSYRNEIFEYVWSGSTLLAQTCLPSV